MSASEWGICTI